MVDWCERVDDIQCGETHNLLMSDYTLYSSGTNDIGQCGLGNAVMFVPEFTKILMLEKLVKKFSTGGSHTLVITTDDRLIGFGNNIHMQAGIPGCDILYEPTEVDAISNPMVPHKVFCGPKASVVLSSLVNLGDAPTNSNMKPD